MWGDSERAITLETSDDLAAILFQITGAAHIPWQDPRWQELLHGYNVWVHLEEFAAVGNGSNTTTMARSSVVSQATASLLRHGPRTSNLAAFCLHVTRMLREVLPATTTTTMTVVDGGSHADGGSVGSYGSRRRLQGQSQNENGVGFVSLGAVELFSNRIALVGKARAVAGALNLLRIFCHAVIVEACQRRDPKDCVGYLRQMFLYQSRDSNARQVQTASDLLSALCQVLVSPQLLSSSPSLAAASPNSSANNNTLIPELYDTAALCLQLLLVLLSTQLYQPMVSSFQKQPHVQASLPAAQHFFWNFLLDKAREKSAALAAVDDDEHDVVVMYRHGWTPRALVLQCLQWHMQRPKAPPKSICHYLNTLAQSVVQAAGSEKKASDGMYENHLIVMASLPLPANISSNNGASTNNNNDDEPQSYHYHHYYGYPPRTSLSSSSSSGYFILDATRGVLVLSSTIILLPFRLVSLALGALWNSKEKDYDKFMKGHLASQLGGHKQTASITKDALWLSDSVVADLSTALLLLLVNNDRAGVMVAEGDEDDDNYETTVMNPFRNELVSLSDNRWETDPAASALPDLPDFILENNNSQDQQNHPKFMSVEDDEEERETLLPGSTATALVTHHPAGALLSDVTNATTCSVNFEWLFESFGLVTHTELGALLLYTVLQASPSFAEAVAVRSDLDALILPMLRTLYYASSSKHFIGPEGSSNSDGAASDSAVQQRRLANIRSCPFRSPSQLYVIIILLLIFSQDAAFGPDAFRRIRIPTVPFYKERNLKDISLGSLLILSLLRSLTFNLNRLSDPFLLSNCCAILMNLSNSVVDIHEYAAMRLVSVAISTCKKFTTLIKKHVQSTHDNPASPTSQYREVAKTLLRVLRQCLASRVIESNLHLLYALVYHCTDLRRVLAMADSPFRARETRLIEAVASTGADIVEKNGARAAAKALKVLAENMAAIKETCLAAESSRQKTSFHHSSSNSNSTSAQASIVGGTGEDFTFTYEEEADPEVFFVPYIWEVIVCAVTAGSIGWRKRDIKVFPLLDEDIGAEEEYEHHRDLPEVVAQGFAEDVSDIV